MAHTSDILSLLVAIAFLGAIVYAFKLVQSGYSSAVQSTKDKLGTKGVHLSSSGIEVKTSKRYDREGVIDKNREGLVKAVKASSFRPGEMAK